VTIYIIIFSYSVPNIWDKSCSPFTLFPNTHNKESRVCQLDKGDVKLTYSFPYNQITYTYTSLALYTLLIQASSKSNTHLLAPKEAEKAISETAKVCKYSRAAKYYFSYIAGQAYWYVNSILL
jgi:hypothetical protein